MHFTSSTSYNSTKIRRSISSTDTYSMNYRKWSSESDQASTNSNNNNNTPPNFDDTAEICPLPPLRSELRRGSALFTNSRRTSLAHFISTKSGMPHLSKFVANPRRFSVDATPVVLGANNRPRRLTQPVLASRSSIPSRKQSDDLVRDLLIRQDKKALLSLGLLVIVCAICWTPFTVSTVIYSFDKHAMPAWLINVFYWILAANSAVNPFLYGIWNSDFRKVLISWLHCQVYHRFRLQEALVYCQVQQNGDAEQFRDMSALRVFSEIQNETL